MKKTRSFRINEKTHQLIISEAKTQRRSVGATLDIMVECYFEKSIVGEIKPKKAKSKEQHIDFLKDFSNAFQIAWIEWLEYKKSVKNEYKTLKTQAIAVANLTKQCQGVEKRMIEAIYHSIGNNYKGIYEKNGNSITKAGTSLTDQFIQKITGTN